MSDASGSLVEGWHLGLHPGAAGLRVRSLGRVELPLGEALRLEMEDPGAGDGVVHIQYSIATDAGPWALWVSCPQSDLADREATLREILPVATGF